MQAKSVSEGKSFKDSFVREVFTFPLYIITNPFKAFSDIKYEKKGSVRACIFFMVMIMLLNVMRVTYLGKTFQFSADPRFVNIWIIIAGVLVQTILIVVANWSVTVLIDGSGSFREIFMVVMYAQYPYIWLSALYILLSHVLSLDESSILAMCLTFSYLCIAFYGFIGIVSVHGFTFFKGLASVFLTVVALVIIVFVLLMLVSMFSELVAFVDVIRNEIVLHYF